MMSTQRGGKRRMYSLSCRLLQCNFSFYHLYSDYEISAVQRTFHEDSVGIIVTLKQEKFHDRIKVTKESFAHVPDGRSKIACISRKPT
jgi:hypothetical protein